MGHYILRISLLAGWLLVGGVLAVTLWAAVASAPIIQQVEAELGRGLTCEEAYAHREINAYFYPQRAAQGDTLYTFSLFAPFVLLIFAALLAGIVRYDRLPRWRWVLVALGGVLLAVLVLHLPVINTIVCAIE